MTALHTKDEPLLTLGKQDGLSQSFDFQTCVQVHVRGCVRQSETEHSTMYGRQNREGGGQGIQ
jgi:hypothetical protein